VLIHFKQLLIRMAGCERFEVLILLSIRIVVFRVGTVGVVDRYQCFKETCCLHLLGIRPASSKTVVCM